MLYLNTKEFEEMEYLSRLHGDGNDHAGFIKWILHSGEFSGEFPNLNKLHKYDVIGAVLTGEYKKAPTAKELLKDHQNNAQSGQSLVYSLQSFYTDLRKYGLIKEENSND
ncbi:hypothetical protein Riggi_60 [Bacillus phage Riggi]|uniref:Uncharacterized protein n=1 Tax=Bacillus phage Riggi TaxID=2884426 RepID=U5PZY7_9CAUD|nr:hypothetical protein Riggi_60 [Bacillus phage Riggi]AGY48222.1 hypothetical protein Riggi_60 [Bacillus phage Riggi]